MQPYIELMHAGKTHLWQLSAMCGCPDSVKLDMGEVDDDREKLTA